MNKVTVTFYPLYGPGDAGEDTRPFTRVFEDTAAWSRAAAHLRGTYSSIEVSIEGTMVPYEKSVEAPQSGLQFVEEGESYE